MPQARYALALVVSILALAHQRAQAAPDPAYGEYLSATCVSCHLRSGEPHGGVPTIAGMDVPHFVDAMNAYRNNQRDNVVMRTVAQGLSDEDIAALAAYFSALGSSQKP